MPENGVRSTYSQCPVQIYMCDDDGIISTGTAFYFMHNQEWFLITNWHNISGRNFLTKSPLSKNGRFPTYLKAKISSYVSKGSKPQDNQFTTVSKRVEIYANYQPVWFEHPEIKSNCDVVAIPLERPSCCPEFMHNAANKISTTRIPIEPGNTVFIIGFPSSISVAFGLPVWKSGYIASEPHYPVTIGGALSEVGGLQNGIQLPAFYIDSQTREGMSGSPVFASYTGCWDHADPYAPLNFEDPNFWSRNDVTMSGRGTEFVGCYSGRIGLKEDGAALGLCWGTKTIQSICTAKIKGTHPQITQVRAHGDALNF